jgi:hypothetical protein
MSEVSNMAMNNDEIAQERERLLSQFSIEYPEVPQDVIQKVTRIADFFNTVDIDAGDSALHVLFSMMLTPKGLAVVEGDAITVWDARHLDGIRHCRDMLLQYLDGKVEVIEVSVSGPIDEPDEGRWN